MIRKIIPYDWIKLFVFLLLVILLGILLARYQQESMRPDYVENADNIPEEDDETRLDEPVINPDSEKEIVLPELPAGADTLAINFENNGLIDVEGILFYELSENMLSWQPVIPDALAEELPADYTVKRDGNGIWHILANNNELMYVFDQDLLIWKKIEVDELKDDEMTPDLDNLIIECPNANPRRITGEGSTVKVINTIIPLRRTPGVESKNVIVDLQKGDILEVVGAPVCTPYLERANLWWFVRTADGVEGYAAEGSAISNAYYLQEID